MRAARGWAVAGDGTAIGYEVSGKGPVLLLVHSAAADRRQWARLAPLLSRSFTVVAMDRRGRGLSGPLGPDHSLQVEYGDIAAVATSLGGPVHVLGHSSGARFALHAATRIPDLRGLVLYEPPAPESFTAGALEALAAAEAAEDREGILRIFLTEIVGIDGDAYASLRGRPIWPLMLDNALTLPSELRAVSHYRFEPADVAGVAAPVLCLLGDLSGPELRDVASGIISAVCHGRIRTLPGQGHGAMFSAPELLASEVERFVASSGT